MTIQDLSEKSDEELRVMCGELCGWTDIKRSDRWNDFTATPPSPGKSIHNRYGVTRPYLPIWTEDLNAMHEAEKVLTGPEWLGFMSFLEPMADENGPGFMIHATARQRCIAFILVKQSS